MNNADFVIATLLSFVAGAMAGTLYGFTVTVSSLQSTFSPVVFPSWLAHPILFGWWPWALFGGLIAALLYTVTQLARQ